MTRGSRIAAILAALIMGWALPADATQVEMLQFDDLAGWTEDDHQAALAAFVETCGDLNDPYWSSLCSFAKDGPDARTFFELFFRPVAIGGPQSALFTGYFEPELHGSTHRTSRFRFPIYRKPPELNPGDVWKSRDEIESDNALAGRGLEIAWIDDPVDVFFLQIQGSGRIRLSDGSVLRVGYGGKNGHEYRSIGQELVRRGIYQPHQVSAEVIRSWVRRNPAEGAELLRHNPSFVFFRPLSGIDPAKGPLGAMNRSVTPLRTIAVDPAYTPLGAPVWIEKGGRDPMRRLMIAQDTGSAIKGPQRADIFFGTGDDAGKQAGTIRDPGRMIVLLPIDQAFQMASGG